MKASKKVKQKLFTKKKNGEMAAKIAFDDLRMSKLHEIFTAVAIVCHRFESLAVLQNNFDIILL